jgi:hypothetical protein
MRGDLAPKRLHELLHYDAETGVFTWRVRPSINSPVGKVAGYTRRRGYTAIGIDRSIYLAHRLAWFYVYGKWPIGEIDHINGVKTDNRIANLRDVDRKTNAQNIQAERSGTASGLAGVTYHPTSGKWRARVWVGDHNKSLGLHDSPEAAHQQYINAKRAHHKGNTL